MAPTGPLNSDRRSVLKAAGALGAFFGSSGLASATEDGSGDEGTELLLGITSSVPDVEETVASALGGSGEVVHSNETLGYVTVDLPDETPEEAIERLERTFEGIDAIEYVEENATIELAYTPNDPHFDSQYAPQRVNADDAWGTTLGDSDVLVSVIDQGIDYTHENLEENMHPDIGRDFVDGGSNVMPRTTAEDHGTIVGGIAAGATDNGTGHAGISNCSMLSARALSSDGGGSLADIADAVQWSTDQGADVINMSLASGSHFETLQNACDYAVSNGTLPVAAAGNDGGAVSYPARYDSVLAVSALTQNDSLASFSNRGSEIDLAAPGSSVVSTDVNDSYTRASGTSMASPVVAGVAALVLSVDPTLSPDEVREILRETASDIGLSSQAQGHGRVNAAAAVDAANGGRDPDDGEEDESEEDESEEDESEEDESEEDESEEDESEEDESEDDDGREDAPDDLLAFVTDADADASYYDFVAEGPIEFADAPYDSPSGEAISGGTWSGDEIEEHDDGTWTATGGTSTGHGDAYRVDGPITEIEYDNPDGMWLELGGEEMTVEEIIEETGGDRDDEDEDDDGREDAPDDLLAFVTEADADASYYDFVAEGPVEFADAPYDSPSGEEISGGTWSGDEVEERDDGTWVVSGGTSTGHGDAYLVDGPITEIEYDNPDEMWLELGGEEMTVEEIIQETGGDRNDDDQDDEEDETPDDDEQDEDERGDETPDEDEDDEDDETPDEDDDREDEDDEDDDQDEDEDDEDDDQDEDEDDEDDDQDEDEGDEDDEYDDPIDAWRNGDISFSELMDALNS